MECTPCKIQAIVDQFIFSTTSNSHTQCTNSCPGDPSGDGALELGCDKETPELEVEAALLDFVLTEDTNAARSANLDKWEAVWWQQVLFQWD